MNDQNLLEELRVLLSRKKSKQYYAERLGITVEEVTDLMTELREQPSFTGGTNINHDLEKGTIEVSSYYDQPPTPEQVIKDHKIDIKQYKLSNYWSKQKTSGWQVSALFSKLSTSDKVPEVIDSILSSYTSKYTPIKASEILQNTSYSSQSLGLFSLPDFHIDKLDVNKISLQQKVSNYQYVLDNLLYRAYNSHNLEEIVFVIGNDFFHTDTFNNTTTSGTPVDTDMTWEQAYEAGFDLLVQSITKLKQFCTTLHIYLVQGNHPRTKEYYLTHALEVFFKNDKGIIFHRQATHLKVHKYGETLLCFNHGNNINDKLPLAFATSFYKEWGECRYKEILLGDKHHNAEKLYKTQGEAQGVRMRILPALCGTDRWHQDNLFTNSIQAGIALVYDKDKGKVGEFECRI